MVTHEIEEIEGLEPTECEKLRAVSIRDTEELLLACRTSRDRSRVAKQTGLGDMFVLRCAQAADLLRVAGIEAAHARLLECIGVDTIRELRVLKPSNLVRRMRVANRSARALSDLPSRDVVTRWILDACRLPAIIEY